MPVLPTVNLSSPPTNAFGLYQYLAQRLPGYDPSEYLREINSAYVHVWEEISKLRNDYFTNIKTVTVAKAQFSYDLMFNADGGLSAPVSSRMYTVTRIRIQPPTGGLFQTTTPMPFNDPDYLAISANPTGSPTFTGPYYWRLFGRNNVQWGLPLAVGTTIEVIYTIWPIAMTYQAAVGTISSAGTAVTGVGTTFTQMVQPDFQASLPTVQGQEEIQAELVCNPTATAGGQIYRVATITSDTALTTATAIAPVLAGGSTYVLATLPEIPREHIRVIASIAMGKMYSIDGDDARVGEWLTIATSNMQMMKDSLMERQAQAPPRKQRFQYGIGRRNRAFLR